MSNIINFMQSTTNVEMLGNAIEQMVPMFILLILVTVLGILINERRRLAYENSHLQKLINLQHKPFTLGTTANKKINDEPQQDK